MARILTRCPVCEGDLKAVRLKCDCCGTVIENSFDFPDLLKLTREQMEFVEVFIRSRGNIKDVERELGISYPTVRAKLDQVIEMMAGGKVGLVGQKEIVAMEQAKQDVIQRLEKGEITPEMAIAELEKVKGGNLK